MKPLTSANSTDRWVSSPPGGASSYQIVQRLGFLRDGRICIALNGAANGPRNGNRHCWHRRADGIRRLIRRMPGVSPKSFRGPYTGDKSIFTDIFIVSRYGQVSGMTGKSAAMSSPSICTCIRIHQGRSSVREVRAWLVARFPIGRDDGVGQLVGAKPPRVSYCQTQTKASE